MEKLDPLKLASAKAKGRRPFFFKDRDVEMVLSIVMAVAQELAVLRQRLDTVEALLEEQGVVRREDLDAFQPEPAHAEARARWTQEYLARILRILQQEREAIARGGEESSEEAADRLSGR